MIVIFQNNKITAVDKKLLQILDCTLNDIGEKISKIDLALHSLQNNQIKIDNKTFDVKESETVSIDNFYIYKLHETDNQNLAVDFEINKEPEIETEKTPVGLEDFSFDIKPLKENHDEQQPKEEIKQESSLEDIFSTDIKSVSSDSDNEIIEKIVVEEPKKEEAIPKTIPTPQINIETNTQEEIQPKEISITFDDEFEEIEKILSLNNEEAKELILEDLQKAANDFEMDIDNIKELYNDLINQIETNKNAFYNAIEQKDYEEMHKISHSLKGASLNLRISNLALILKTIDEKSKEEISFEKLELLVNNFYTFVDKVKTLEVQTDTSNKNEIPEFLKELILDTVKNYVATQNDKKLKKDLKYIEKLLNTKINSIEELQDLIKAEK